MGIEALNQVMGFEIDGRGCVTGSWDSEEALNEIPKHQHGNGTHLYC